MRRTDSGTDRLLVAGSEPGEAPARSDAIRRRAIRRENRSQARIDASERKREVKLFKISGVYTNNPSGEDNSLIRAVATEVAVAAESSASLILAAQATKLAVVLAGAAIPVLVVVGGPAWLLALLGSAVMLFEMLDQIFRFQERGIVQARLSRRLRRELIKFVNGAGPYREPERQHKLFETLSPERRAKFVEALDSIREAVDEDYLVTIRSAVEATPDEIPPQPGG